MSKKELLRAASMAIFLIASAGLVFAGGEQETEPGDGAKPYEGVTLNIMAAEHFWFNSIEVLFEDFEEETGAEIVVDKNAERSLYDRIKTAITPSYSDYDIVVVDQVWLAEFARNGLLEDLGPWVENQELADPSWSLDDFIPAYVEGLSRYDDKLWTIPLGGHSNFLAYNTSHFQAAGIAEPPATMDQLLNTAQALDSSDHAGIVFRAQRGHPIVYTYLQYFYPFGGTFFDDNWRPQLSSPEGIEALEFLIDLTEAAPADVASYTFGEMLTSFQQGASSIYQDANVPGIIENPDAAQAIEGQVAYAPFPTAENNKTVLAGWTLGIPAAAEHKELAWKLIQYQSNRENAVETFAAGRDPILVSTFSDPEAKEAEPNYPFDVVLNGLQNANPDFRPRVPELSRIQDVLGLYLSEALTGQSTPEEALEAADNDIAEIMEEAGYYD